MLGNPLTIGPVRLETNLMLAPIAGWCDLAWRETCRTLGGVGLACTDLLSPKGLLIGSDASVDLARTSDLDRPIGMQLYGADPEILAEGARWCADHGATVVDLNMGCPVDKVCKKNGGSKLMTDPDLARRIADACRAALPDEIPLTAKMRLGWSEADAERDAAGALASSLAGVGVAAITVHGRTTEQRFKGECRRDGIRRVVERMAADHKGTPVIANGDVCSASDAVGMLQETRAAGVMIGRGAFKGPWVFREAWEAQLADAAGRAPRDVTPSEDEKLDAVLGYFERMRAYRGDWYAVHKIRQKIGWLGKTINGSHCRALKDGVRGAERASDVKDAVESWRAAAPRHARESAGRV